MVDGSKKLGSCSVFAKFMETLYLQREYYKLTGYSCTGLIILSKWYYPSTLHNATPLNAIPHNAISHNDDSSWAGVTKYTCQALSYLSISHIKYADLKGAAKLQIEIRNKNHELTIVQHISANSSNVVIKVANRARRYFDSTPRSALDRPVWQATFKRNIPIGCGYAGRVCL